MSERAVEQVRSLLDKRVRVKLKDGRLIEGLLECYDKLGNMILGDSREVRLSDNTACPLGLVLAPHHMVISILVPPNRPSALPPSSSDPMQRFQKLTLSASGSSSSTTT